MDSNSLKPRQSDNEADRRHWQQLLNSQNQWKVWEGTWWRMLVFSLISTQLSTPRFTDTHTSTHTHACSYHLLSVILQGSNVFYTNIVYATPLLCLFRTDHSWHVTKHGSADKKLTICVLKRSLFNTKKELHFKYCHLSTQNFCLTISYYYLKLRAKMTNYKMKCNGKGISSRGI